MEQQQRGSANRCRNYSVAAIYPSLPLDCLASTYRSYFKIQIQGDCPEAPMSRPSQLYPCESTAKFLRLRNRSISASIDLIRVFQLNTSRVHPLPPQRACLGRYAGPLT